MALAFDAYDLAADETMQVMSKDADAQLRAIETFLFTARANDLTAVTHPGTLNDDVVANLAARGYSHKVTPEGDFLLTW